MKCISVLFCTLSAVAAESASAPLTLDSGLVTFDVGTNISAVSVHGKSTSVHGLARIRKDAGNWIFEEVTATLPVESLTTGMSLRDDHMRKHIFTTADGQTPELAFSSGNVPCKVEPSADSTCKFNGTMSIRGVEKPITLVFRIKPSGAAYRAIADASVKLSDYGIERPSQFGVKCADEVKLHLEIAAKATVESSAVRAGASK